MGRRYLLVVLAAGLLLNCSKSPEKTGSLPLTVVEGIESSGTTVYSISPENATVRDTIRLNAKGNIRKVEWYVNGMQAESAQGRTFTSGNIHKGDLVYALVNNGKDEFQTNEIVIKNSAPMITSAGLSPPMPRVSDRITAEIKSLDADKDIISYQYKWHINNQYISDEDYLNADLKKDDIISVDITPFDGADSGKGVTLTSAILNSLPIVSESTPSYDGKVYSYQVSATDPDGDKLSFSIEEGPEGMKIDPASGLITWEVKPDKGSSHEVKVAVKDGSGTVVIPFSTTVGVSAN